MTLLIKILAVLLLAFTFCASFAYSDAVFLQKPQNHTLFDWKEPFFFNCSTNVASNEGMDWLVRFDKTLERICSSKDFHDAGSSSCQLNYSMEVPNDRTLNLIVDPQIARLGSEYCCQFNNGAGKKICSYLTIASPPVSTAGPEFVDTTTVTLLDATTGSASPAFHENAGLIVGAVVGIIMGVLLTIVLIFLIRKFCCKSPEGSNNNELTESKKPLQKGHSSKAS